TLNNNFPINTILTKPKITKIIQFNTHNTTFNNNPLTTTITHITLHKLSSPKIKHNINHQSQTLHNNLNQINNKFKI
ncbi:aminotransferase class III-fold pyridoxal phosphate-dependent enzyme, partial [Xanthomonas citri pv. citri]|nr:aminotransferase class III-fold pyridoxal phosphate-dependent enzyme [Xanthomonas citri pv. citri]